MGRKYRIGEAIPDPISDGLKALTQSFQNRAALEARKKESDLDRALRDRQVTLTEKEYADKTAPINITESYLGALGPELGASMRKEKSEFSESNYDAGKPYQEFQKSPRELDSMEKAFQLRANYLNAIKTKAEAEKRKPLAELALLAGKTIPQEVAGDSLYDPSEYAALTKVDKEKTEPLVSVDDALKLRGKQPLGGALGAQKYKPGDIDAFFGKIETGAQEGVDVPVEGYYPPGQVPSGVQGKIRVKDPEKLPGVKPKKPDNNEVSAPVQEAYRKWQESRSPDFKGKKFTAANFPPLESMTTADRAVWNQVKEIERTEATMAEKRREFGINTEFKEGSAGRDAERLRLQKTVDDKNAQALYAGVTQLKRLQSAVEIADRIDPNLQKGVKSRLEGLGARLGVTDQSEASLEYEEMVSALDTGNIREILEGAGKAMTNNEVRIIERIQVMPNRTKQQVKLKARAIMEFLNDALKDRYRAVSQKTPYGLEGYPEELETAYQGVRGAAGKPLRERVRGGEPLASDGGVPPPAQKANLNPSQIRIEREKVKKLIESYPNKKNDLIQRFEERTGTKWQ